MDVLLTRKGGRPSGEAYVVLGAAYQVPSGFTVFWGAVGSLRFRIPCFRR